jgi:N-acetylmuramoyl-L-alanine amidase
VGKAVRKLDRIILHCTATPEGRHVSVDTIRKWHVNDRGWRDIGYHFVIYLDGSVHVGRPIEQSGAHTSGHNATTIGVVYVGGCDAKMKAKDTMNAAQETAFVNLVKHLRDQYGPLTLHGHNEYAAKACPSFKVKDKFKWLVGY